MGHLVLLGDSTLDNAAYVGGGRAVVDQVRRILPDGWRATLLAVDGGRIEDVHRQFGRLPEDVTHLALSVGGNDLLAEAEVMAHPASTVGQAVLTLAAVQERFEADYADLLRAVVAAGLPAVVCTVYGPRFPDPDQQRAAAAALCLFDDAIVRAARVAGLPVVELRAVCSEDSDFANSIEPSSTGGRNIARALCEVVLRHDFSGRQTLLYP